MPPRKVKYEDIQWPASIDADHTIESFQNQSYKDLAGIVLNDKYDIRYSAAAGTPSTAVAFAKKKRLKAILDQDINADGVDDIILYDVNGDPVYINGYHFRPSEFLLRNGEAGLSVVMEPAQDGWCHYVISLASVPHSDGQETGSITKICVTSILVGVAKIKNISIGE